MTERDCAEGSNVLPGAGDRKGGAVGRHGSITKKVIFVCWSGVQSEAVVGLRRLLWCVLAFVLAFFFSVDVLTRAAVGGYERRTR